MNLENIAPVFYTVFVLAISAMVIINFFLYRKDKKRRKRQEQVANYRVEQMRKGKSLKEMPSFDEMLDDDFNLED